MTGLLKGKKLWALGFGLWALGFGLWALGFGLWALGFGLWALGFGLIKRNRRNHLEPDYRTEYIRPEMRDDRCR
jgi:hypothetical protein